MLLIQVSLCYILKHLKDRKALSVYIYYTWCDIILIFKLHKRTRLTPRSSRYSLKIRMTSHPCNKYEHTTLSYLLSVKLSICPFPLRSFSTGRNFHVEEHFPSDNMTRIKKRKRKK